jgi:F0F1-type ATP synthase assembly protein I
LSPNAGRFLSLGFLIPAAIVVGYAIGYGLDHVFGTRFLSPVFLIAGAIGGLFAMVREAQKKP